MKFLSTLLFTAISLQAVDFEKDIKPIFDEKCIKCHGPEKQKSDLRLDSRESILKGGDLGEPGAFPGHPEKSTIIEFISLDPDDDEIMPPKGDPLTKEQIALISQWIKEGAKMPQKEIKKDEKLWSLEPVVKPIIPVGEHNPVDAFLSAKLNEKGLNFSRQADPVILLRRLHIILTGILPSNEEKNSFLKSWIENSELAYKNKVEELLASKHFGERWAQHWLDSIRWAETSGSESNLYRRNAWQYRDYVIRSFNQDKPYTNFIKDQLAGDQTGYPRATGFLVSGPHVPPATVGQQPSAIAEARYDRLDQVMQTVGASMMGMTLGCARCHTHKFDPIKIKDYYALLANFQGLEFGIRRPELADRSHPIVNGKKIMDKIKAKRKELNKSTWREQWLDRYEAHFPGTTTKAIRLVPLDKKAILDEVEIINTKYQNIINEANISTNLKGNKAQPELLRDGEIGQFFAFRSEKISEKNPYIEFRFKNSIDIRYITFSRDRKAKNNTDFIVKDEWVSALNKYSIQFLNKAGKWQTIIANTAKMKLNDELQKLVAEHIEKGVQYEFIGRFKKPIVTHVLKRGSPAQPGAEVAPNGLSIITADLKMSSTTPDKERRLKFAEWLADAENPLTARVMVNRLWHHTFGNGIVSTLSDFGNAGAKPSHPALLNYLAAEFSENNWSTKHMLRLFVHSKAFKQDNKPKTTALKIDANSRFLWRFAPRRAEAEVIRDSILKLSNKLDTSIGGPSYRIHNEKKRYDLWEVIDNHSEHTWRRMIYQERMRGVDDRMFTAFDFPDCGQVLSKRPASTTPLQALNLMNSKFMLKQCDIIAESANDTNTEESIRKLYLTVYNRQPSELELTVCLKMMQTEDLRILARALLNSNEFIFIQ